MITLIAGPPCAGKTTLARRHATPTDTVLDVDDVARMLGSSRLWMHSAQIIALAAPLMQRRILLLAEQPDMTAWVIQAAPHAGKRERMAELLHARIWLVDPGIEICLERARFRPPGTAGEIRKWYRLFTSSALDERVAA